LDFGHKIIPIKFAPFAVANSASRALVTPHTFTKGLSPPFSLDEACTTVRARRRTTTFVFASIIFIVFPTRLPPTPRVAVVGITVVDRPRVIVAIVSHQTERRAWMTLARDALTTERDVKEK
jgi:hypothetical protein